MRVKELLLAALSRANHIEDGTTAESRELEKARKHFNSALSTYSDSNLITAFQQVLSLEGKPECVIGKYNLKRGKRMHTYQEDSELPNANLMGAGKDYAYITSTDRYYEIVDNNGTHFWSQATGETSRDALASLGICDYIPDIIVPGIVRIVAAMYKQKEQTGAYSNLNFVPLSSFYITDAVEIYCSVPKGDNKVQLLLPEELQGMDVRVVYNANMEFQKDDFIELPEVYRELLTLATTVGLLSEDADSDPTQLNNYKAMLDKLENQIAANNVNTRRIVRKPEEHRRSLYTGAFICRR